MSVNNLLYLILILQFALKIAVRKPTWSKHWITLDTQNKMRKLK